MQCNKVIPGVSNVPLVMRCKIKTNLLHFVVVYGIESNLSIIICFMVSFIMVHSGFEIDSK